MKESKVALVNPGLKTSSLGLIAEPIGLAYIASYLEKNGIDVKIIDEFAGQNVKKEIKKFSPDIVGVTAVTPLILDAYKISDMCRENGILTVIGGRHVSALPKEALKHADIVVDGDGENAMLKIIRDDIKSGIISTPYIRNIDDIPMPARHLLNMDFYIELRKFFWYNVHSYRIGNIITSRGCPYSCIYCYNSCRKIPIRFHSAERVVDEIKFLIENYNIDALGFVDDNFLMDKNRAEKICKLMKENDIDISWKCLSRVDSVDLNILKKVKKAGCKLIYFGFESNSQRILNLLNKGTTVEQNQKAVDLCRKLNIDIEGYFMIGNPTETLGDLEATKNFIKINSNIYPTTFFTIPYPGTKLWEYYITDNKEKNIDWSKFLFSRLTTYFNTVSKNELKIIFNDMIRIAYQRKSVKKSNIIEIVKILIKYPRLLGAIRYNYYIK
jgi:anaerobic magnesium-protoporphyrin IX monomethyl ester cyclase